LEHRGGEWLQVCDVGDPRVGHDRRGIRVHENGLDALLAQRAAGLRPRVVELRGLSDEDRPRADDQHFHRSNQPPPTATTLPPTCTPLIRPAEPSMRAYRNEGRPISKPCSVTIRSPALARPWRTRYAASGPFALPVAGSSVMPTPVGNIRPCTTDPGRSVSVVQTKSPIPPTSPSSAARAF